MIKIIFLILFTCLQFISVFPQTPSYYHYTSADGLASSTVFSIIQDKAGFIWFGTQSGLSKFDGKNFTTFSIKDGLNSNMITNLAEGDSGEIYIDTYEKGINVLKNNSIKNFRSQTNGKPFTTTYLLRHNKKIYSYSSYGLIYVMNEYTNQTTEDTILRSPHILFRLAKLSNGKLIGLTSNGLFDINNNNFVKINIKDLPDTNYYCLAERSDGSYFIGSHGAIYQIKNNQVINKFSIPRYNKKVFYYAFCDKDDNIWFSVSGKGFFLIPSKSDKLIDMGSKIGLVNTQINDFFEDKEGNIWICTFGKGVYCLNNLYLRNYTELEGLNNNNIISLSEDRHGRILIGTITGLSILENGIIHNLSDDSGNILGGYINRIKIHNDDVYVCWSPESSEIKNASFKELNFKFLTFNSFDHTSSNLYIYGGIGNGIKITKTHLIDLKSVSYIPIIGDSLYQNRINDISEDLNKNIWIGTSNGLCKLTADGSNTGWKKTYFTDNPVLSFRINSIYNDTKKNNVWFAGAKGIAKYNLNDNSITTFTSFEKFNLAGANTIVSDSKDRLWVGTMTGLYLFEKSSLKLLNVLTGLASNEVLSLCYNKNQNKLFIGTSNGLSILDINSFDNYKDHIPKVIITSIKVGDSVYTDYKNLVFKPDQNNVYINFVALDYSAPKSVRYLYIFGKDTTETSNKFIDFSSLRSGSYKLRIMAKNQNSAWGEPVYLNFRILPHFTETIWFDLLIISIILFLFIIIFIWRLRINNEKAKEKLELSERINELKHQALSAMMNPHFIFNALNSVQFLINDNRKEEANDYISMMARLIRKNLDSAGNAFILLSEEINRLKLYLNLENLRFREKFSYEIITGENINTEGVMIPNMIIQPFVENTLWHGIINSGANGLITISFTLEKIDFNEEISRALIIKISDNGIGINEARKNKKEDHISKGIQIIEERLKLLSEKMELPKPIMLEDLSNRSSNSHGTEVIISLPLPLYRIVNSSKYTTQALTD